VLASPCWLRAFFWHNMRRGDRGTPRRNVPQLSPLPSARRGTAFPGVPAPPGTDPGPPAPSPPQQVAPHDGTAEPSGPPPETPAGPGEAGLTQDALVRALAEGGRVDLGGREVVLDRFGGTYQPIPPKERTAALMARKDVEIVRGTLRCEGPTFALVAKGGCTVVLRDVWVVGGGVGCSGRGSVLEVHGGSVARCREHSGAVCSEGGTMRLHGVEVREPQVAGVLSTGEGSSVTMVGGSITGAATSHGAACQGGAELVLRGVAVAASRRVGIAATGSRSRCVVEECSVSGSQRSHGIACQNGASLEMRDTAVADCRVAGVLVNGRGSRVAVRGGSVAGSLESHGVACQDGAEVELSGVCVEGCRGAGVFAHGQGSKVTVTGGTVRGCVCNDILSRAGAEAHVSGVDIGSPRVSSQGPSRSSSLTKPNGCSGSNGREAPSRVVSNG